MTDETETGRLHDEILGLRAELAQVRDLLRTENQRANSAINRETTAEDAEEEHRLALSEALGLGTGAPWDAIQERVAVLRGAAGIRAAALTEAADTVAAHPGPCPWLPGLPKGDGDGFWWDTRDRDAIVALLRRLAAEAHDGDTHICKPDASTYHCPTSGEAESDCHGGFDQCCDRPDLHRPAVPLVGSAAPAQDETRIVPCNWTHLRKPHGEHPWQLQPGMGFVQCEGYVETPQ